MRIIFLTIIQTDFVRIFWYQLLFSNIINYFGYLGILKLILGNMVNTHGKYTFWMFFINSKVKLFFSLFSFCNTTIIFFSFLCFSGSGKLGTRWLRSPSWRAGSSIELPRHIVQLLGVFYRNGRIYLDVQGT